MTNCRYKINISHVFGDGKNFAEYMRIKHTSKYKQRVKQQKVFDVRMLQKLTEIKQPTKQRILHMMKV